MKKFLKLSVFILTLGLTVFVACKKEVTSLEQKNDNSFALVQTPVNNQDQIKEGRNAFAKSLAKAMINLDVRSFIKERLVERYNSSDDYEFLFIEEKNNLVGNTGKTFLQVIADNADKEYDLKYFDELPNRDPLLSITMSEHDNYNVTDWTSPDFIPNVAAQTDGMGEYYQYDFNGQETIQPTSTTINEILVAIWSAEVTYLIDSNGNSVFGSHINDFMPSKPDNCEPYLSLFNTANSYQLNGGNYHLLSHSALINAYYTCPIPSQDPPIIPNDPCICPRNCEILDETLVDFKINGWQVFKNIDNQAFETRYVFHGDWVAASRNSLTNAVAAETKKMVSPSQTKKSLLNCSNGPCQGKFINVNFRLWTDWNLNTLGDPYKISWAEVDPGETTTTLQVPLSVEFTKEIFGQKVTFKTGITPGISRRGNAIVPLGDQHVFYCDPILSENTTGSITFRCN